MYDCVVVVFGKVNLIQISKRHAIGIQFLLFQYFLRKLVNQVLFQGHLIHLPLTQGVAAKTNASGDPLEVLGVRAITNPTLVLDQDLEILARFDRQWHRHGSRLPVHDTDRAPIDEDVSSVVNFLDLELRGVKVLLGDFVLIEDIAHVLAQLFKCLGRLIFAPVSEKNSLCVKNG